MPSIVDEFPYPWAKPEAQELHLVLTNLYPQERGALFVAEQIGLQSYLLPVGQPALYLWVDILRLASSSGKVRALVTFVCKQHQTNARRGFLEAILADAPVPVTAQPRKADGSPVFVSGSDAVTEPEALLFRDDLSIPVGQVPVLIDTLRRMMELSPSVCLLRVTVPTTNVHGTGFRIGDDLLLTNHHVLFPYGMKATKIIAEFGFETDASDAGLATTAIACDIGTIVADASDDWGVLRVAQPMNPAWPIVDLAKAVDPQVGEAAFILQHPQGQRKRIGFVRNTVTDFDDRVVHYLTDTQPGSSGSPVFSAQGFLLALHHAGGTPQDVAGKPPITKNEGIRVSRIVAALRAQGIMP